MSRPLRASRYLRAGNQDLARFITDDLHYLDYDETLEFYNDIRRQLTAADMALLGANDRFFLLTGMLGRRDAVHPWLFERCREVEADTDDCLDLWAREHYKSTIITFAGGVQEILVDPDITIGIFSHTRDIAGGFSGQIKQELQKNDLLKLCYPDVLWWDPEREAPQWSTRTFTVKRNSNPKEATVEAWGLVDGQPTSKHFRLRIYDDVVTKKSVTNPVQVQKTTEMWELSDNLGAEGGRKWHIGTRYCSTGDMRVLMADWSHKPIRDIREGDEIVGWELRDGARYLRRSRVLRTGMHPLQPVNRFTMENGRSVTCTADHKWWRGPHGGGPEYAPLALPEGKRPDRAPKGKKVNGHLVALRELLTPIGEDQGRLAGWLAGFFDGEGTMALNTGKNRASGRVCIVQSMANPGLIDETRRVLGALGFEWTEAWWPAAGRERMKHDRCIFGVRGGWAERYRFLAQISPAKRQKLADSLFARLSTDRVKLAAVEDAGDADVYWLETETGNYVIEGFCSSNSFADSYGVILERKLLRPRLYPATHNGRIDGKPVFWSQGTWEHKKKTQRSTLAAQLLQNPVAGQQGFFEIAWFRPYEIRPAVMNVYILGDPSKGRSASSDRTAFAVIGVDSTSNKYLLDGYRHRMKLSERWKTLKMLHEKWSAVPGVQMVRIGYEQYGMQADIEYFEERMRTEKYAIDIEELNWPREGGHSKEDRVQRLQPDFEDGAFYLPAVVWHEEHGAAYWKPNEEDQVVDYWKVEGETSAMRKIRDEGQGFRIAKQIQRRNEDKQIYDLTRCLFEEMLFFPFGSHDDLVDCASRIYDMDPLPAVEWERAKPEVIAYPDA